MIEQMLREKLKQQQESKKETSLDESQCFMEGKKNSIFGYDSST